MPTVGQSSSGQIRIDWDGYSDDNRVGVDIQTTKSYF
jgi:hypothetical protein